MLKQVLKQITHILYSQFAYPIDSVIALFRPSDTQKVFCIGLNKTGTTTLEYTLKQLGYKLGIQRKGEILIGDWEKKNYKRILRFCETADAFQDIPFSLPGMYQILDQHFPNAKFVLTIRNDANQWYNSLVKFHSKRFADGKRPPTPDDLKRAFYISKGRIANDMFRIFNTPLENPYDQPTLIAFYNNYIKDVSHYFSERPDKLIIINVGESKDYLKLCQFLNRIPQGEKFPWLNKT